MRRRQSAAALLVLVLTACGEGSGDGASDGGSSGAGGTTQQGGGSGTSSGGNQAGSGTMAGSPSAGGSPSTGGSPNTGGSLSTGGSSGSAQGGSGGAASGQVRGGASINVLAPGGCSLSARYEDFPSVAGGHPVTATDKSAGVAAGDQDADGVAADVSCALLGKSPYTVGGSIKLGGGAQQRLLSFQSKLDPAGSTGSLVLELPGGVSYHGVCSFSPVNVDASFQNVWGTVSCEMLTGDAQDVCALGPSYFFFENCAVP